MSRGRAWLVPLAAVVGACAGSPNQATSTSSTRPATVPAATTARTTAVQPRPAPRHRRHHPKRRTVAASNVRLPATFVIRPGGRLSPPAISAPTSVNIVLTVLSGDGRGHRVRLRSPGGVTLSVPPGGRASALVGGLRQGSYAIAVDGAPRGQLVIGVTPGP